MPRFLLPPARLSSLSRAAVTLTLLLCGSTSGLRAQGTEPPHNEPSWLPDVARQAGEMAKSAGNTLNEWWNSATTFISPTGPTSFLPGQISDDDKQFFAILGAVGLTLKEVTVGKGVVPEANYHFVATRDPTEADFAKAENLLRAYRDASDGMRARAKQRIARATLDTMATTGFALTAMDVTLSPWPDASYQVSARPRPETPEPPAPSR